MTQTDLIRRATATLIRHVDELTALDQATGDGDHGLNMKRGAEAIDALLPSLETLPLNDALKRIGMSCMSTIGGASGPVFGTLCVTLAKTLPPAPVASDWAAALQAAIDALMRLGKARIGQKTLLDVLAPVQALLAEAKADEPAAALAARVKACALQSAEATAQLQAERGRASFLGERALGHVDPGSRSLALVIAAVCDGLGAAA